MILGAIEMATSTTTSTSRLLRPSLPNRRSKPSRRWIVFDGAAEAKLIALAYSKPPTGRKRWTLQLLEEQVVELKIADRASDNTIGRTLKKPSPAASEEAMGHPVGCQRRVRSRHGGRAGGLLATAQSRMSTGPAWTRRRSNSLRKRVCPSRRSQGTLRGTTTSMSGMEPLICS
jgi:hypothetical protein